MKIITHKTSNHTVGLLLVLIAIKAISVTAYWLFSLGCIGVRLSVNVSTNLKIQF